AKPLFVQGGAPRVKCVALIGALAAALVTAAASASGPPSGTVQGQVLVNPMSVVVVAPADPVKALWPVALRLEPGPGIPKPECAVEDEPVRGRVGIGAEVAEALELHGLTKRQLHE